MDDRLTNRLTNRPTSRVVRLDDLTVDAGARTVHRDGQSIELPRLSFDFLAALIEAAPEALSTETLMDRVWKGRVVSPATVAKRAEMLRNALGDDAAEPRYVSLVRGYGYRLATRVEPMERPGPDTGAAQPPAGAGREASSTGEVFSDRRNVTWPAFAAAAAGILALVLLLLLPSDDERRRPLERSIAVLPFEALSDEAKDQWFADGLSEEIGHSLARTGELRVAGRTSILAELATGADAISTAKALGVAHLLTGSVRRDGDQLRVIARLIEASDGFQLWSETFDVTSSDSLAVQRMIAERVADRFDIRAANRSFQDTAATSSSPEAYALYLQAVSLSPYPYSPDLAEAQRLIERVVELDPGFARGWTRLAAIHGRRLYFDPDYPLAPQQAIQTIREAIDRALAIDPTLGEAYINLAGLAWAFDRDLERTARLLEQAVRFDPWNLGFLRFASDFARAIGDLDGARRLGEHILRRDPLCESCRSQYVGTLQCLGDLEAAERELRVLEDMAPGRYTAGLGDLSLARGDFEEAEAHYARLEDPLRRLARRIRLHHARGEATAARELLPELMQAPPGYWGVKAGTAAVLGETALAIDALKLGMQRRYVFVQSAVCAPEFDALREQPEWQELMLALGQAADGSPIVSFDLPPLPGFDDSTNPE